MTTLELKRFCSVSTMHHMCDVIDNRCHEKSYNKIEAFFVNGKVLGGLHSVYGMNPYIELDNRKLEHAYHQYGYFHNIPLILDCYLRDDEITVLISNNGEHCGINQINLEKLFSDEYMTLNSLTKYDYHSVERRLFDYCRYHRYEFISNSSINRDKNSKEYKW